MLGNRVQEGIRELIPIQNDPDLTLAAILALMYGHKRCNIIDKEALIALDAKLKQERKNLSPTSSYYAAVFLFLSGRIDKAKEYTDKVLKVYTDHPEALTLKGWCELRLKTSAQRNTLELFTRALKIKKSIDASLGQVKYYQMFNDIENALTTLNQISIRYPELNIPLVEKMKTQLGNWNWDHNLETLNRILEQEFLNIEALQTKAITEICREGNYNNALTTLHKLYDAVAKIEGSNAELFAQISQLIAKISGKNYLILNEAYKFADKAIQMSPGNAQYISDIGFICAQQEKFKDANKFFRQATKLDDNSVIALCGLTYCTLLESGPNEQARQQIDFLTEIQGDTKIPLLLYMSAKLNEDSDQAVKQLIEACEMQFKNLQTLPFGAEYLRVFDAVFLLDVATELLKYSPIQEMVAVGEVLSRDSLHITLTTCLNILDAIVKACPGMVEGVFQLARVQYLSGDITIATRTLQRILHDIDPSFTDAHLLMAQIFIQQGAMQRALQNLEICLSHNFKVRENPFYHLLNGIIQKSQTLYDEAIKSFLTAMTLSGIKHSGASIIKLSPVKKVEKPVLLGLVDKVSLFIEAVQTYNLMGKSEEANKLMVTAMEEFANTPEKGRLIISNADIFLQQGHSKRALEVLASIQPKQPYYLQAKTKMANIYLKYHKDRLGFAQCFKELVENNPGGESYLMLGDAFMSIQEPDDAIDAYKHALRQNPHDPLLASKLGRAYVKTHQYKKAIAYYKEAILSPENHMLKLDLAELYLKLKQFNEAEEVLNQEIRMHQHIDPDDIPMLQVRTKQLLLLARVHEKAGRLLPSLSVLREARDNQLRLQRRVTIEQNLSGQEQTRVLTKICVLMAEQAISLRDNEQAIHHYREALKYCPLDLTIMAALARLHMQMNEMDQCQRICSTILEQESSDPVEHEAASVMMADISFRKIDFENAAYHFSQLLMNQPLYWTALARLIEVMRRSGNIQEALPFIERAEQACLNAEQEAGLHYCKAMYEWYIGNPNGALRAFNNARRDSEWGPQAIFNMIEICLNPDGDLPTEGVSDSAEEPELRESYAMALNTAERLIVELKAKVTPGRMDDEALNTKLLENFLLLASKVRYKVEKALSTFTEIASQEEYKENVGAIYGIAAANVMLKQTQRAKNQLKRIAKNNWTFEDAEYLERSWLLLADIYIQSNKGEMATDLLERVLKHNQSCSKAQELAGYLAEKENAYKSAALRYDAAWKSSGKTKPNIGYKLAYCYMKVKNYAEAIDVCHQVLKSYPEYATIKKDIMDKCRNNLRS